MPNPPKMNDVLKRLESLEQTSNDAKPSWDGELDKKIMDKIGIIRLEFETQIKDLEERTNERMKKSEDSLIAKFSEIQQQQSMIMQTTFDNKISSMENKFDRFLEKFQLVMQSTGTASVTCNAAVAGKD